MGTQNYSIKDTLPVDYIDDSWDDESGIMSKQAKKRKLGECSAPKRSSDPNRRSLREERRSKRPYLKLS